MQCQRCHAELFPEARYCHLCAWKVRLQCSSCGTTVPPGSKFCFSCGANLQPEYQAIGTIPAQSTTELTQAELRYLDIVGNRDGMFNLGDVLAHLVRAGATGQAAIETVVRERRREPFPEARPRQPGGP